MSLWFTGFQLTCQVVARFLKHPTLWHSPQDADAAAGAAVAVEMATWATRNGVLFCTPLKLNMEPDHESFQVRYLEIPVVPSTVPVRFAGKNDSVFFTDQGLTGVQSSLTLQDFSLWPSKIDVIPRSPVPQTRHHPNYFFFPIISSNKTKHTERSYKRFNNRIFPRHKAQATWWQSGHIVDGWKPAAVDMVNIPLSEKVIYSWKVMKLICYIAGIYHLKKLYSWNIYMHCPNWKSLQYW